MSSCSVTTATSVGDQNPDGMVLGWNSTDSISFYGATPVVQPAAQAGISTSYGATLAAAVNGLINTFSAAQGGNGLTA